MINGDKFNHVSVSHENRDVTWNDLTKVRNEFLDKTAPAYHVIAPVSRHVNLHYNCFHIWQPIGAVKEIADLNNIEWEFAL